jgi:hypothetical protein
LVLLFESAVFPQILKTSFFLVSLENKPRNGFIFSGFILSKQAKRGSGEKNTALLTATHFCDFDALTLVN